MAAPPVVLVTTTSDTGGAASPRVWVHEAYTNALAASGLVPLILPPMRAAFAIAALAHVNGLVLTGGEDIGAHHFGEAPHPATGRPHALRDEYEIALVRAARERNVPTLAICRGAQIANIACGGGLIQDISAQHPRGGERVHEVQLHHGSRLAAILGESSISVNGFHHQAIGRIGDGLCVVGTSPDGIVEAIEADAPAWWMMGVQWHAELLTETPEPWDRRLFDAFASAVRRAAGE